MKGDGPGRLQKPLDTFGPWLGLAILGLVFGLSARSTMGLVGNTAWVDHGHHVIESLDHMATEILHARLLRRGFSLTGDGAELDRYAQAIRAEAGRPT